MKNNLNKTEQKPVYHIYLKEGADNIMMYDLYTTDFDKIVEKAYKYHRYCTPIERIYMDNKSGKFKVRYTNINIFEDKLKIKYNNIVWEQDKNYPWFEKSNYWKVKKALIDGIYEGGVLNG